MSTVEIETGNIIKRFEFWNPATWSIPKLYWDAWSQEQRIHAICRQLEKVIAYADYLGVNVDDIASRLKAIEDGQLDDLIVAAVEAWFEEHAADITLRITTLEEIIPSSEFDSDNTVKDAIDGISILFPASEFDSDNTVKDAIDETYTKNPVFNVKDYGAVGDGIEDDTDAFKAAIDAASAVRGGHVYVPMNSGECYVITDTLDISANFVTVYSNAAVNLSWQTAGIHFVPQAANDVLFNITGSGCTLDNLIMVSDEDYDGTAVYAKMTGAPDTDVSIVNCYFAHWNLGVDFYDRGLKCCNNTFAIMKYPIKIGMTADITNTSTNTQRGIVIERNRFHVSELAVEVVAAQPQGMMLNDNLMDVSYSTVNDGNKLLYGDASTTFRSLQIQNNIVLNSRGWTIGIDGTANGCIISENNFNNVLATNPEGAIKINAAVNCTITGNYFGANNKNQTYFTTINGVNMSNNTFAAIGQSSDASNHYAAIFILTSIQAAIISTNFIGLNSSANARCIRYDGSAEISYTRITNNMSRRGEIFTNTQSASTSNSVIQANNLG